MQFGAIQRNAKYKAYKSPHWAVNTNPTPGTVDYIYALSEKWVQGHLSWQNLYGQFPGPPWKLQTPADLAFPGNESDSYFENKKRLWDIYRLRTDYMVQNPPGLSGTAYGGQRFLDGAGNAPQVTGYPSLADLGTYGTYPWADGWWQFGDTDNEGTPVPTSPPSVQPGPQLLDGLGFVDLPGFAADSFSMQDSYNYWTVAAAMSDKYSSGDLATLANLAIDTLGAEVLALDWNQWGLIQWSEYQAIQGPPDTRTINPADYDGTSSYTPMLIDQNTYPIFPVAPFLLYHFTDAVSGWSIDVTGSIRAQRCKIRWTSTTDQPYSIGKFTATSVTNYARGPGEGDYSETYELIESGTLSAAGSPIIKEVPFPGSNNDDRSLDPPFPLTSVVKGSDVYCITSQGYFIIIGAVPADFWGDHFQPA